MEPDKSLKINGYENGVKNKINIRFETTGQFKVQIIIDPIKTMEELIHSYFEKIGKSNLFGDKSIIFLANGQSIEHDSKVLIKEFFKRESDDVSTIVVNDQEDKINNIQ